MHEKLDPSEPLYKEVHDSLFILFAHNGVYHSMSGENLTLHLQIPPFGFNEQIVKDFTGTISRGIIKEDGLYGKYVTEIIKNLTYALEFTENDKQHKSISTLIDFYRSGSAVDFDKHCVAWTQDRDSHIYFINGLIESYEDHC